MFKKLFLATIVFLGYITWQLRRPLCVLAWAVISLSLSGALSGCNAVEETCHYDAWGDHYCTKTYYFNSAPQPSTVYVVEEKEPETQKYIIENIVDYSDSHDMSVYNYDPSCNAAPMDFAPYIYPPWYCYHYPSGAIECDWDADVAYEQCYEVWLWDDWQCNWHYQYNYCD